VFLCCSLLLLLLVVARDVLGDEHVDDLQRQHCAELLLSHARLNELALSDCAVMAQKKFSTMLTLKIIDVFIAEDISSNHQQQQQQRAAEEHQI
jgi:hypothetical protein